MATFCLQCKGDGRVKDFDGMCDVLVPCDFCHGDGLSDQHRRRRWVDEAVDAAWERNR